MSERAWRVVRGVLTGLVWAAFVLLLAAFAGGGTPFIYIAF